MRRAVAGVLLAMLLPGLAAGAEVGSQSVTVDPQAAAAQTVVVAQGSHARVTILGAGAGEVHFHAYHIEVQAVQGQPVTLEFDAAAAGRFPVEMHVDDPLLGQRERAVLFIEVRAP